MELTLETVTNDMHKIKTILRETYGISSLVEYPGYLSIEIGGRELHAGYYYHDEQNNGDLFQLYDFTDGYQHDFSVTFETYDDLRFIAQKLHDVIATYISEVDN